MKKLILFGLISIVQFSKGQVSLQLKVFIQGYMINGNMQPALYNSNPLLYAPTDCDSITVELHDPSPPYTTVEIVKTIVHTDGKAIAVFPPSVLNNSYFIVIKHRSILETWSKNSLTFSAPTVYADFTSNTAIFTSVLICGQEWMTNNLDVDHYSNGDPIQEAANEQSWVNSATGKFCYYDFNPSTYPDVYGKLYNWFAVNDPRGLCPSGWHVPSHDEWTTLLGCLGGQPIAGGKLKETGTTHWVTPNTGATNSTGFTGLPGGYKYADLFVEIGLNGAWWSSTLLGDIAPGEAYTFWLTWEQSVATADLDEFVMDGFSVRCLKD